MIFAHFADAITMAALTVALAFGADVRWVLIVLCVLGAVSSFCRSYAAFVLNERRKELAQLTRGMR